MAHQLVAPARARLLLLEQGFPPVLDKKVMKEWTLGSVGGKIKANAGAATGAGGVQTRTQRTAADGRAKETRARGYGGGSDEEHRALVRDEIAKGAGGFSSFDPRSLCEAVPKRKKTIG